MAAPTFTPADIASAKSWPFEEARRLDERLKRIKHDGVVLFETGYGPSGPPHIGTFGEVARTTMVRRAFELMTGRQTRLISFSDDMDGMRKFPPQAPNQEMLSQYLQKPLTSVPDPWGTHASFAHHNNAKLRAFLDQFGFDYEFASSTDCYKSGVFDATLIRVLERYDALMEIMLPSLGDERRETYSPILPISPKTGRVLYVPLLERDAVKGEIVFEDEDGERTRMSVTSGRTKLQWKADWAGRWFALGVDYEMAGEDLTESVRLSNRIVKALGGEPPAGFNFQLFVDETGKKISKTKGNGISIEEWLTYASPESLSLFMFQNPKTARKLYFDVIPKTLDEYWQHVEKYAGQDGAKALDNPVWHIHGGAPPGKATPVSFAMMLTLVSAVGGDVEVLKGFIRKYRPNAGADELAAADALTGYAARYFERFIAPTRVFRPPTEQERAALSMLAARFREIGDEAEEDAYQTATFDTGKANGYEKNLRDWFGAIYEVVFGTSEGPRMGPFAKIYGAVATASLIEDAVNRQP
ncbi:MAG: lysine--tRNA ligase [Parvularculaceae bacterium]